MEAYDMVAAFLNENERITEERFKEVLFEAYKVGHLPMLEETYRLAYEYGSEGGFYQILYHFDRFVGLSLPGGKVG